MSDLTLRFWGTRGSLPTPGRLTEKFGGNTTCLELRYEDTIIVIDAGSGIRPLGEAWLQEFGNNPVCAHIFFTHVHWDHIQGFPFFIPAYIPGNQFTIYGRKDENGSVWDLLSGQMQGAYFPIPIDAMQAEWSFQEATPEYKVGGITVRTMQLPHPGGCLGYRLEAPGGTFVLATDSELDQIALNKEQVQKNHLLPRKYEPELLDFFRGADVLVIDCQYTDADYQAKRGWGHNSIATVVDLAKQVQPEMLVLCHHDPQSTDQKVMRIVSDTNQRFQGQGCVAQPLVLAARERMTLRVCTPIRPLALPQGPGDSGGGAGGAAAF